MIVRRGHPHSLPAIRSSWSQRALAVSLAALVALAGCATGTGGGAGGTPAEVARIAPPVTIPAESARRVVMVMTGPKTVTESRDWGEFQREWRETFAEHAKDAGIEFSTVAAAPPTGSREGTALLVDVADYRIVGIGARVFFGVMTGNAYINARIRYASLRDGRVFGEQTFNTSSSAWGGVVARVTPQQVDSIASNVFADLRAAK